MPPERFRAGDAKLASKVWLVKVYIRLQNKYKHNVFIGDAKIQLCLGFSLLSF